MTYTPRQPAFWQSQKLCWRSWAILSFFFAVLGSMYRQYISPPLLKNKHQTSLKRVSHEL